MNNKTKRQLRAEAVERLRDYEGWHKRVKAYDRDPDLLMAVIGIDNWCMTWQENREVLIDLLTDDEPVNGKKPDSLSLTTEDEAANCKKPESLQDSREKLEEDFNQMLVELVHDARRCCTVAFHWDNDIFHNLLDRQAAITERHWMEIVGANANANVELNKQRAELQAKVDELEEENRLMREKFRNTFNNDVTVFGMKLDEVRNLIAENAELKDDNDSLRELVRFMRITEAKGGGITQLAITSKCPVNGEKRNGERCLMCRWCVGTGGEWWCAWNMREELDS